MKWYILFDLSPEEYLQQSFVWKVVKINLIHHLSPFGEKPLEILTIHFDSCDESPTIKMGIREVQLEVLINHVHQDSTREVNSFASE